MRLKILLSFAYTSLLKFGLLTIKTIMLSFDKRLKMPDKLMSFSNDILLQYLRKRIYVKNNATFQSSGLFLMSKY